MHNGLWIGALHGLRISFVLGLSWSLLPFLKGSEKLGKATGVTSSSGGEHNMLSWHYVPDHSIVTPLPCPFLQKGHTQV